MMLRRKLLVGFTALAVPGVESAWMSFEVMPVSSGVQMDMEPQSPYYSHFIH
jgi:hypothetical protein